MNELYDQSMTKLCNGQTVADKPVGECFSNEILNIKAYVDELENKVYTFKKSF